MKIAYFTHSLESCWNHGNAHFLRGVLDDLIERGHEVRVFEPEDAWSRANLIADHGTEGIEAFRVAYPRLRSHRYRPDEDVAALADGADLVIVHEWNAHALVEALGRARAQGARYLLLFHDTHHRAVSEPEQMEGYDLSAYDGVLAFGEALSEVYRARGWGNRVWTWHEAADVRCFHPPQQHTARSGLVWIGNWGDGERTHELQEFLFHPAEMAGLKLDIFGVRYPPEAIGMLERHGGHYRGWAPNAAAPRIFSHYLATVHVPRRYYASILPGIPTIRVFEALACGIPLVSAPWEDAEHLFRPGEDYLVARDGAEMTRHLKTVEADPELRRGLAEKGLETILSRHTCAHRVDQLLGIVAQLAPRLTAGEPA